MTPTAVQMTRMMGSSQLADCVQAHAHGRNALSSRSCYKSAEVGTATVCRLYGLSVVRQEHSIVNY
jgi:hypothetical protein